MQFIQAANIFSKDGERIGRMGRVVIHPKSKAVTHLVIHTGRILARDKVVPIALVEVANQDRLVLRLHANQLVEMPDFGMMEYKAVDKEELQCDEEPTRPSPPPAHGYRMYPAIGASLHIEQPQMRGTRINTPAGTVAVKQGAKIVAVDGKHVGHMERLLTRPQTDRISYFQMSRGWWHRELKLVPVEWVDHWEEDRVRLTVAARTIQDLPE